MCLARIFLSLGMRAHFGIDTKNHHQHVRHLSFNDATYHGKPSLEPETYINYQVIMVHNPLANLEQANSLKSCVDIPSVLFARLQDQALSSQLTIPLQYHKHQKRGPAG